MENEERIRRTIAKIADRPKNVTFSEIEWIVNHLSPFYGQGEVGIRDAKHGKLIKLPGGKGLTMTTHNPGSKQLKPVYVKKFLDFMIDLGWYEE